MVEACPSPNCCIESIEIFRQAEFMICCLGSYYLLPRIRVDFDDAATCDINKTFARMPSRRACDFRQGIVHKAYSTRVRRSHHALAEVIRNYQISSLDATGLSGAYATRQSSELASEFDAFELACAWVKEHEDVWQKWLRDPTERQGSSRSESAPIVLMAVALGLVVVWFLLPFLMRAPTNGTAWSAAASWLKPSTAVSYFVSYFVVLSVRGPRRLLELCKHTLGKPSDSVDSVLLTSWPRVWRRWQQLWQQMRQSLQSLTAIRPFKAAGAPAPAPNVADYRPGAPPWSMSQQVPGTTRLTFEVDAIKAASQAFMHVDYPRSYDVAATFIQQFLRGSTHASCIRARQQMKARLSMGMQFAVSQLHGCDPEKLVVGLTRAAAHASQECQLRITAVNGSAKEGVDFVITEQLVTFPRGESFVTFVVTLLDHPIRLIANADEGWSPSRNFELQLALVSSEEYGAHTNTYDAGRSLLGSALTCHVTIISQKRWPMPRAEMNKDADQWDNALSTKRIYWDYVMAAVSSNLTHELWWLAGETIRAFISVLWENVLFFLIIEVAIPYSDLDYAFSVGALFLIGRLLSHVTSHWHSPSASLSHNGLIAWLLDKWSTLPWAMTQDLEMRSKYLAEMDLINCKFHEENDYAVFASLIRACINFIMVLLAMILPFNIEATPNSFSFSGRSAGSVEISIAAMIGHVFFLGLVGVSDRIDSRKYLREVRRWMELKRKTAFEMHDHFGDTVLHRSSGMLSKETKQLVELVSETRNTKHSSSNWLDLRRRELRWPMTVAYVGTLTCAPLLVDVYGLHLAQLLMLLSVIRQSMANLDSFCEVGQRLRVAQVAIVSIAALFNDGTPMLREIISHSSRQVQALRRIMKHQEAVDGITLHRVRFASSVLHDVGGNLVQMSVDSHLSTGRLYGLATPSKGDPDTLLFHNLLLDLICRLRTPSDGAVLIQAGLEVGLVAAEPLFMSKHTLLENLRYACGEQMPERMVWSLCQIMGLPPWLFRDGAGHVPIALIKKCISQTDLQLLSLVRKMLCKPDILLVQHLGSIEPATAKRLGHVFSQYVQGAALMNLTRRYTSAGGEAVTKSLNEMKHPINGERTIIWHASAETLELAGVRHQLQYKREMPADVPKSSLRRGTLVRVSP